MYIAHDIQLCFNRLKELLPTPLRRLLELLFSELLVRAQLEVSQVFKQTTKLISLSSTTVLLAQQALLVPRVLRAQQVVREQLVQRVPQGRLQQLQDLQALRVRQDLLVLRPLLQDRQALLVRVSQVLQDLLV